MRRKRGGTRRQRKAHPGLSGVGRAKIRGGGGKLQKNCRRRFAAGHDGAGISLSVGHGLRSRRGEGAEHVPHGRRRRRALRHVRACRIFEIQSFLREGTRRRPDHAENCGAGEKTSGGLPRLLRISPQSGKKRRSPNLFKGKRQRRAELGHDHSRHRSV